jgi:exodeoxyribonuclease-3
MSVVRKGYSGVAMFTKQRPLSVNFGLGVKHYDDEGRCVYAEFDKFYVICIYNPHAKHDLSRLKDR